MSSAELNLQPKLNAMLRWGVVFSIVWLAGLGSLIALVQGLRARQILNAHPELSGKGRALWCIVVGGLGVAAVVLLLVASVVART